MNNFIKYRLAKKWWFNTTRGYTWFSFRYWWINYLLWILLIGLLVWMLCKMTELFIECDDQKEVNALMRKIDRDLETCCNCITEIPPIDTVNTADDLDRLRDSLGGCVGEITATLSWNNLDDLDLHLIEPDGTRIYFDDPQSANGGVLDVDMNAEGRSDPDHPIENICYQSKPPSGKYKVLVHFFDKKTSKAEIPYTLYIKVGDKIQNFKAVHTREKEMHQIFEFNYPTE